MTSKFRRGLFIIILIVYPSFAAFASPKTLTDEQVRENRARREFLYRLGFDDISSRIKQRLQNHDYTQELNRRQMEANAVSYEVLNASRELAILMLGNFNLKESSAASAQDLSLFAAKMLNVKPYAPATDYPSRIMAIQDEGKRQVALVEWLDEHRRQQMNEHKLRILSDITALMYGKNVDDHKDEILEIDRLLTTIVDRMYLDNQIGNSKYFGRALTALLVRDEKLRGQGKTPITETLSVELRQRYNLYLENFIGDTMIMPTKNGEKNYKIENGTMMLSRNLSPGSLQISWAAIPKSIKRRWQARFSGVIGTPLAAGLYVTPKDTIKGISLWQRIKDRLSQSGVLREGYSHIVYYQVKEDPETGIKMPRVIHNYPDRTFDNTDDYVRTGGVALVYPEQVIDLSHHSAVYFSSPNAIKTKAWFDESWKKVGYKKEFFPSSELQFDETGLKPVKTPPTATYKTKISEVAFNAIHDETDPEKASREIWQRFADGLQDGVERGIGFHWPDPYDFNIIDMTYCSLFGKINMLEYVGIDIEQDGSQWSVLLRGASAIGKAGDKLAATTRGKFLGDKINSIEMIKKAQKITKVNIVAPSSVAIQPFMEGHKFLFDAKTPEQRAQSSYMVDPYHETDMRLTEEIQRHVTGLVRFEERPHELFLDYGGAIRDLEYGMVIRGSRGVNTPGVNIETLADIASVKAYPAAHAGMLRAQAARKCAELNEL